MIHPEGAPMPAALRALLGADQHPARAVDCPWCGAAARRPCRTKAGERRMTEPHPARISAWARYTAACPTCQAPAHTGCLDGGRPLPDSGVHPERLGVAGATT